MQGGTGGAADGSVGEEVLQSGTVRLHHGDGVPHAVGNPVRYQLLVVR